jgi:hypothetical protein
VQTKRDFEPAPDLIRWNPGKSNTLSFPRRFWAGIQHLVIPAFFWRESNTLSFPHFSGGNPGIIESWMPDKKLRA